MDTAPQRTRVVGLRIAARKWPVSVQRMHTAPGADFCHGKFPNKNQPAFFRRALALSAGFATASLAFRPEMGSSISACPLMRLRPFLGGAEAAGSCAML